MSFELPTKFRKVCFLKEMYFITLKKTFFHEEYFFYEWWIIDLKIKWVCSFHIPVISIMSSLALRYGCTHLETNIHIVKKKPKNQTRNLHLIGELQSCLCLTLPFHFSGVCLVKEDRPWHRDRWEFCLQFWKIPEWILPPTWKDLPPECACRPACNLL